MIDLQNVCFSYANSADRESVKNLTLRVREGEFVVLTGVSGSGKTTVTRIINGLAPAFYEGKLRGEIRLGGQNASELSMWERGTLVGSIFQDPRSQFFSPQVEGEIAFGCENLGYSHEEIRRRVRGAIADLKIADLRGRNLHHLSNGEKQKVAIASIRSIGPKIYVFDEPSSNLDTEATNQLCGLMKKMKDEGCTLIVSEHRIWYLMALADRFLYLKNGEIEWDIPAADMRKIPPDKLNAMGVRNTSFVSCTLTASKESHVKPSELQLGVDTVSFRYQKKSVLLNFSFTAYPGEIIAITGQNGTGKTTLAKILCGLYKPQNGTIRLGNEVMNCKQRMKRIRFIPHDTAAGLFAESVREELLLTADKTQANGEKADGLLRIFGLDEYKDRHPATLSGGQKQRLVLAAALMDRVSVMVFDEPTSGLDSNNMRLVADAIRRATEIGTTVFIITHDGELVQDCCNRVLDLGEVGGN
jgi:energy-coupling factor transport system ATP-binding protein